jgi:2-polyprenyl-3-methyl-5-hydroxy-6-metoxy-1,4-benzoquinol methylase
MFGNNTNQSAQQKVTAEWNGMAGEWDDLAGGYAVGFYKKLWETTGLDPSETKLTVVDFGCGTGILTSKLRNVCSNVVAIDASPKMIEALKDKIRDGEWANVQAITSVLGDLSSANENVRQHVEGLYGTVDLIVASSVMTFIPEEDMEATMKVIGRLLKPNGIFCHSDWPKSEATHPDAMSDEKSVKMYSMGGLEAESTQIIKMDMSGPDQPEVFFGVAKKAP